MNQQPLILLVDDEQDLREVFGTKLRSAGYRIEEAENGVIGLEKARALQPDLILMDVKMPGMSGPETILKMKEDPQIKHLKFVFLTSLGDPDPEGQELDEKYAEEFGAAAYIHKTDNLEIISNKVREVLEGATK